MIDSGISYWDMVLVDPIMERNFIRNGDIIIALDTDQGTKLINFVKKGD